jgi:hypothetical protein
MGFVPTPSRSRGELILQTCSEGNSREEVGDMRADRATFNAVSSTSGRCSSSGNSSKGKVPPPSNGSSREASGERARAYGSNGGSALVIKGPGEASIYMG